MVLDSFNRWLIPLVVTTVSLYSNPAKALAQTVYPFSGEYETTIIIEPISDNLAQVSERAVSDNAPYNLGLYEGLTYSFTDENGNVAFNIDPTVFGMEGYPLGYISFGNGANTIFGNADANASIDFENLTAKGSGILNITGGTGMFKNATGTLTFVQEDTVNLGQTTILNGVALVNGYITVPQSVPEPTNITPLIGLALTGVGFFRYLFPN
ncbi:hypothetical protein [Umezakia ovalisporum]|jgi:hypothetical protein|uniref:hypothetical protein n=1 Tax=Umezakia ovalisporum TaxID=75695 RepID=UPI0035B7C49E